MKNKEVALVILMIASTLAGCTTSDEIETNNQDTRISDLESSQLDLALAISEQEQTNTDLPISISQIESANMQAIQSLDED